MYGVKIHIDSIELNKNTDKACSVVNNVGRALVKKKVLILVSTEIDMINNSDVYDKYKDLYLSKKECEERLLQSIQTANGLTARVGAKKSRWHSTNIDNSRK